MTTAEALTYIGIALALLLAVAGVAYLFACIRVNRYMPDHPQARRPRETRKHLSSFNSPWSR